jgi:hypothetical protein
MNGTDPECAAKGIPEHLHQCGRSANQQFDAGELLYRRVRLPCQELTAAISFDRKSSSVNRSKYCHSSDDVLWNDEHGGRHEGYDVLQFPADAFEGKKWQTEDNRQSFTIEVFHDPKKCNYPHSDFRFIRNGQETDKVKPGSIKMQIREHLLSLIKIARPSEH